jgi:copper(I)-binding protein
MRKSTLSFAVAFAVAALPALAGDLEISDSVIRTTPKVGAGFLTIKNATGQDDRLIGAQADIAKTVELHTHVKDGEVMRMRRVDAIPVPAGGVAELKPGGDHVMFINLTRPLAEGQKVAVTLVFEKAGKKQIEVPVVPIGGAAPAGH